VKGPNYAAITWDKGIWRTYLDNTYRFVWENLKPEEDPDSFYLIVSSVDKGLDTDLTQYKRLILILDDPAKRLNRSIATPEEVICLWYGMEDPPKSWLKGVKKVSGLHFWDAYPFEIPERSHWNPIHDTLIMGNTKRERGKRLNKLLTGTEVMCVGFDWSEYFPVAEYKKREGGLLDEAGSASLKCRTELIYHSPQIKAFLSLRLPNTLRRGAVPMVDLDHDPNRKLLITEKLRDNMYVDCPEDVKRASDFALSVTREDIQAEYDAQVERAVSDMFHLRSALPFS
jgi:hypothetical protein